MTSKTQKQIQTALSYFALIALSIIFLLPLYWLVRSSFMDNASIFQFPPKWIPNPIEWENYDFAFSRYPLFQYLGNTLTILIPSVLGTIISSTLVAYGFSRISWYGRDFIFGALLSTLMLPYVVTLIPTFFMWSKLGFVNTYVPLILPSWFGGGMFNIFLLRQFFRTIPQDYDEAATLDGANHFQILWYLIVPMSRSAIITIAIFTFLANWNDFLGPLIYISDPDKQTLALGLSNFQGYYSAEWGHLMAASTLMLLPVIILFFVAQGYFIKGIALGGLKG
ncbi:carbohydrate ABC transporter permease [Phototrophicus methaneseepsis]|uniref:Carbohydrate ABC transporter permease n=1 Tax=Phototrophicus methaneseepsis TaxID=2710758 RepID=A0A7S8IFM1_9CHLR|nr:carbohydrate ABC transporter permease [Phototrophicus methaneseepsis]QPC83742.1 carbohydrate ABC transporter permease [Phototrophicus methaneseepsis]